MKMRIWQIWIATAAVIGLSVVFAIPFMWMLGTSLKVEEKIQSTHMDFLPRASFVSKALMMDLLPEGPCKAEIRARKGDDVRVKPLKAVGERQEVQVIRDDNTPGDKVTVDRNRIKDRVYAETGNYTAPCAGPVSSRLPCGRSAWAATSSTPWSSAS